MPENQPLQEIIDFISYIDQLKTVIRKNGLHDPDPPQAGGNKFPIS